MNKTVVHRLLLEKLEVDLDVLQRAAQTAYEAATHEENVAENKYDTLGLEASYLATGQARRVEQIRQSLKSCRTMALEPFNAARWSTWKPKTAMRSIYFWRLMPPASRSVLRGKP